jgi:hypothetical protein
MIAIGPDLESMRVARYAIGLPCYICGEGNSLGGDLCRHCRAPLSLSEMGNKARPPLIGMMGPAGVGKTVYLGMLLDLLSRQSDDWQLLARGAFSVSLQQAVIHCLSRCEFPEPTPCEPSRWNWVHAQINRLQRAATELIVPDISGQALMEEVQHPNSWPVVRRLLPRCQGIMLLVDAAQLHDGVTEPDFVSMKLLSFLGELHRHGMRRKLTTPVAVIFTKADQCEAASVDAEQFAKNSTPGLWRMCQQRLARCRFFAAGVVGASGYSYTRSGKQTVPLRIEPRGVIEPFRWLVEEVGKRRG